MCSVAGSTELGHVEVYINSNSKRHTCMVGVKNMSYIRNYARRNNLSLVEAKSQFFSNTHKIFLEAIPEALFQHINKSSDA